VDHRFAARVPEFKSQAIGPGFDCSMGMPSR
jgi:hypothetical protein